MRIVIGAQPGQQLVVGVGGAVGATERYRLVGAEQVGSRLDEVGVAGGAALDQDLARRQRLRQPRHRHVTPRPRRQHVGDEARVLLPCQQQVVGAVERDKALGVPGRLVDPSRVVDAHHLVGRRVEDQQRQSEVADRGHHALLFEVDQQLAANTDRRPAEAQLGLAVGLELRHDADQGVAQVLGVTRRADGRHGLDLGDAPRRRQHRGAAQAVADQDLGAAPLAAHQVGRRHKVLEVGREVGVGEVAGALAEAGEVEAEDRDPALGQRPADAHHRLEVLAAGEAVGEQGAGGGLADRQLHPRRQAVAKGACEVESERG
jgi:hypothetical protein